MCYGVSMLLNYAVFRLFNMFIQSEHICQFIALVPTTIITYILLRIFVFPSNAFSGVQRQG